jgi:spoIIIJ-associated protein
MADKAVNSNQRVVLEAMPAYERRIVHIALREHPDVITKSIGRDKNRKITIIPK